jgi:hypothetical protein
MTYDQLLDNHIECLDFIRRLSNAVADPQDFIERYSKLIRHDHARHVNVFDAFSRGQLESKLWLRSTVESLGIRLGRTWILAGWIGTLGYLLLEKQHQLDVTHIRSFDIDHNCADLADLFNKAGMIDQLRFKALTADVNDIDYDNFELTYWSRINNRQSYPVSESVDSVINTSCDHMGSSDNWWQRIPTGKLVILQNNNWHENDQHDNSVDSIDDFSAQYPLSELLYAGEIECTLYNRYMLIGRK